MLGPTLGLTTAVFDVVKNITVPGASGGPPLGPLDLEASAAYPAKPTITP